MIVCPHVDMDGGAVEVQMTSAKGWRKRKPLKMGFKDVAFFYGRA